ncbi:MAG: hypothetical protein ACU841_09560 [Gammaproteobacteria bacterium]
MTTIDFDKRRQLIKDELISVAHNIGVRKREMAVLEQRREQLLNRLNELDSLRSERAYYGMIELIRLCRTPCWNFRPLDPDTMSAARVNKYEC